MTSAKPTFYIINSYSRYLLDYFFTIYQRLFPFNIVLRKSLLNDCIHIIFCAFRRGAKCLYKIIIEYFLAKNHYKFPCTPFYCSCLYTSIWQLFIVSSAAACFSGVTPAQQLTSTEIITSGYLAFRINALETTHISVQTPTSSISSFDPKPS